MVLVQLEIFVNVMMVGMLELPIVHKVCIALHCFFIYCFSLLIYHYIFVGECPTGVAWADKAYGNDVAHQTVECSNAGVCDYNSGKCKCFAGYSGSACQRSKLVCHNNLSNYFCLLYFSVVLLYRYMSQ